MRFLLTRRWLLLGLTVVFLALLAYRLGVWQFHRLHDREQSNTWTERNLAAEPTPVDDVLAVGRQVPADGEWRRITVTGTYDAPETVLVRYQTRDGKSGVELVTPLLTGAGGKGPAVLVDRGWVATDNTGDRPDDLPAPPPGRVTVQGYVRADATGRGIDVEDRSTRAISSRTIGEQLDYPVYTGFVDAVSEDPAPSAADSVVRPEPPDLGEGPHLFYGLQWWFFAALAVFGFCYLAWDELRKSRTASRATTAPRAAPPDATVPDTGERSTDAHTTAAR